MLMPAAPGVFGSLSRSPEHDFPCAAYTWMSGVCDAPGLDAGDPCAHRRERRGFVGRCCRGDERGASKGGRLAERDGCPGGASSIRPSFDGRGLAPWSPPVTLGKFLRDLLQVALEVPAGDGECVGPSRSCSRVVAKVRECSGV